MKKEKMNAKSVASLIFVFLLLCSVLASGMAVNGDANNLNITAEDGHVNFIDVMDKPVFLFFYTDWCHFCHEQKPIIDELEPEYGEEVTFSRINGEKNPQMIEEFGVESFPAMFLITDENEEGYVYQQFTGFTAKSELIRGIESALESDRGNRINITGAKGGSGGDTNYPENTGFERWYYFIGGMVNAKNGNLYLSEEDIGTKARGFRLAIRRSYNSLNSEIDSPVGKGWVFNYNTSLKEHANNDVALFRGDGAIYNFTYDSGSYIPPAGIYENLTKDATGFSLWFKDGTVNRFNLNGTPQYIQDKNGNKLNFNYASEKLTSVSDDSGLFLNFTYAGDKISRVSDPLGRTIRYYYNGNKLETVTDAEGANVTYKYTDAGMLESRINRVGGTTLFFYDDAKVEQISLALYNSSGDTYSDAISRYSITYDTAANETTFMNGRGYPTTIKYNENGNPVGITDALDGVTELNWANNSVVNLTDANGNLFTYEYDAYGNLINKTDPLGNSTLYTWDVTDTSTKYIALRKSIAGGEQEQKVTTRYNYDSDGNLIELIDALGNSSYYEHDSYGNLINQTNFRGFSTLYSYDTHGNQITVTDALGNVTSYDYDRAGRMLNYTNARGFSTTYTYNKNDNILNITDATGNITEYTYNAAGALVETKDEAGWGTNTTTNVLGELASLDNTSYKYDETGNLIEETDALGRKTRYEYDALDRLINITDALNQSATHEYDSLGNMVKITNKRDFSTFYEYDALNRVINYTDSGGAIFYRYDGFGNLINVTDKLGNPTLYAYDNLSRLTEVTYCNGDSLNYSYDANGNVIRFRDANGWATLMEHDALDRVIKVTDATGNFSSFSYDEVSNILGVVDKRGDPTSYEYDALDRLTKITDALGSTELFKYDERGNLILFTDKRGYKTEYSYDELMGLNKTKNPAGSITEYNYDAVGNLIGVTDASGNETSYSYDDLNRLKRITNPLGDYTEFSYDPEGNVEKLKDFRGFVTEFNYDALNRLTSVKDNQSNVLRYTYDAMDNVVKISDPKNQNTTYGYDCPGRLMNITSPMGNTTAFTYDGNWNILSKTDGAGRTINYTYDQLNRQVNVTYPTGIRTFNYDADGNLIGAANDGIGINDSVSFTYDALNRVTNSTTNFGNFSKAINYTYDAAGNVISIRYPEGGVLTREFDSLDQLTRITDAYNNVTTFDYGTVGRLDKIKYPNGMYSVFEYDGNGNLLKLYYHYGNGTTALYYDYDYDENGNIVEMSTKEGTTGYVYDSLNMLTNVTYPSGWEGFTYDALGNRVERATGSGTTHYTYNAENQILTDDVFSYAHDKNGNLISKTAGNDTSYYAYDFENQMSKIVMHGGINISYAYSPIGSRTFKNLDGSQTYYIHDGENVICEYNASGVPKAEYVHAGLDLPITMRRDNSTYHYLHDAIGSIRALSDAEQNIPEVYDYDAFGNTTTGGVIENPYRFTAREYEPDAGLYYYRLRTYDPTIGRFASKDPLGMLEGPNLYTYVDNNPVTFIDPFGTDKDYGYELVPEARALVGYGVDLLSFEDFKSRYLKDIEGLKKLCEGYGGTFDEKCFEDAFIRGAAYRNYLTGASALTEDFRDLERWYSTEREKIYRYEREQVENLKWILILGTTNEAVKKMPVIGIYYGTVETYYKKGAVEAGGHYGKKKIMKKVKKGLVTAGVEEIGEHLSRREGKAGKLGKFIGKNSGKIVGRSLDVMRVYGAYTNIKGFRDKAMKEFMPNTKVAMNTLARLHQAKLDNLRKEAEKGLERAYQAQLQSTMEECCKIKIDEEEIPIVPPLEEIMRAVGDEPVVAVSAKSECPPPHDPEHWRFYKVENCGGSPCECYCVYKSKAYPYKYRTEAIRQCKLGDNLVKNTLLTRDYKGTGGYFRLKKAGITLDCNAHVLDGGGVHSYYDKVTIKNCVIRDVADDHGLWIIGGNYNVVKENTIINCSGVGISLYAPYEDTTCDNARIENNTVTNNKGGGISYSGYCRVVDGYIIQNNKILNNSAPFQSSLDIEGMNNSIIKNNEIANGHGANPMHGIFVGPGWNNTISGNIVYNNSGLGMRLYISNSTITGNKVSNNGDDGIAVEYGDGGNNISNNNCSNNVWVGVYVDGNDNTISYNNCSGNGHYHVSGDICGGGISIDSDRLKSNNTVSNNRAVNNSVGITLSGGLPYPIQEDTIVNNDVSYNDWGIYIVRSKNTTIKDNDILHNEKYGIRFEDVENEVVSDNKVEFSQYGISSVYSENNTIENNTISNCSVIGITVQDSPYGDPMSGFWGPTNTTIADNTITGTAGGWSYGIWVQWADNNTITNNTVNSHYWGIYITRSNNNTLYNNIANSNDDGIYLQQSLNDTLTNNTANSNADIGIRLSETHNCTLTNNTLNSNEIEGIYIWDSNNNVLCSNTINSSMVGIELAAARDNTLIGNVINGNEFFGLYLWDASDNNIENNSIVRNTTNNESWGIYVDSIAENNELKENTVGSNYPTKITIYDYLGAFQVRGVENPPKSPSIPEYPTTRESISRYVEMQNLSADTTLFLDFHYEDKDVEYINEDLLMVWKHNGTAWDEGVDWDSWNGTRKLDTENNIVGVEVEEFCIFAPLAGMPVHNIDIGEDFNTIQEAIDDEETVDGHTITVDRGYTTAETKENLFVDKELTIKSSSGNPSDTVIEAENEWVPVIEVVEDDVTIQGFTIKGATHKQGVVVDAAENVDIKNCIVRDNYFGVLLDIFDSEKSTYCTIQNCQFTSNTNGDVYINQSDYNNVFDCTFEDKYGVIIDSGTENCIWDNTFTNNAEAAIHVFSGRNNSIKDNQITSAKIGMLIENTEENEIRGNKIENADECGVKLDNSENNNLVDCSVSGSVSGAIIGIDLQDSKRNTITGCSIHDLSTIGYSATGIRILSGSTHNKILHSTIYNIESAKSEGIDVGSPLNEFYNITINGIISRGNSEGKGIDVCAYANSNIFNNVRIRDVHAKNDSFGFYLYNNNNNTIKSCTITNISADYNNAHGLHLNRSNSTGISNTTLKWINATSNDSAILIEGTDGTNIFDNVTLGAEYPTSFNLTYSGDIEIDEVEIAPGDPVNGKNISKYMAMTNRSNAWADLKIFYNDSELGEVDENSLRMWKHDGEWAEVPPPNGVNTVENYVYANISEFSVFAPLENVPVANPDLVITEKWVCWPDNCTICYNVTNIGNGTAPACHNATLYVDDVEVAHDHVPVDLAPGESYIGCFDLHIWTYTPPSDNITVCADNNETLVELDETNNCLTNIWMCGDVAAYPDCNGVVDMGDVILLLNNVSYPEDQIYALCNGWAGDCRCTGVRDMGDVILLLNNVSYPEDPRYALDCCC